MMFKELAHYADKFGGLNLFQYVTFRASYGAVTALLLCLIIGPFLIKKLRQKKVDQMIRQDGPESHLKTKVGTPTMGGLMILFAMVISILLWQDLRNVYTWLILGAIVGFGFVGFLDDYLKVFRGNSDGLSAKLKLVFQFGIATALVVGLFLYRKGLFLEYHALVESAGVEGLTPVAAPGALYFPFFKDLFLDLSWFYIPFGVVWIVGFSNAVNLTDGLDGLASGLIAFVAIAFAILSYLTGRPDFAEYLGIPFVAGAGELAICSLALAGASLGFLWFNAHPAKIFMGDTGSLMLGGLLGLLSLIVRKEILLIFLGGVFVIETLSVILQVLSFKLSGKRIFKMAPIHHHFELKGWTETQVVIRFWIIGGLLVIFSLSSLKIQ